MAGVEEVPGAGHINYSFIWLWRPQFMRECRAEF